MLAPENEVAWGVWARYGWTLIDWASGRFLIEAAMKLLSTLGVEDVKDELFNVTQIADTYLSEEAKRRTRNE